jgi:hypothetical protein
MPHITARLAALLVLAACAQFPQIDAFPPAPATAAPTLVPIDGLLAQADAAGPPVAASLQARAARLQARAALMRGPILDPDTRAQLAAAIREGTA